MRLLRSARRQLAAQKIDRCVRERRAFRTAMRYVRNTQCGVPNGRLNERNWRNLSTLAEPCNGEGCAHPSRRSATTKLSFQGWLSRDNENRQESTSAAQATVCLSRPVKTASPICTVLRF